MNAKQKAVEEIRTLGRSLKGMIEVADELEQLGSLEQALEESKVRLEAHRQQEQRAFDDMQKVNAALEEKLLKCESIESEAYNKATKIMAEAEEETLANAKRIQAKVDAEISEKIKAMELKKSELSEGIEEMQKQFDEVSVALSAKQKAMADLESKMADIRSKLGV